MIGAQGKVRTGGGGSAVRARRNRSGTLAASPSPSPSRRTTTRQKVRNAASGTARGNRVVLRAISRTNWKRGSGDAPEKCVPKRVAVFVEPSPFTYVCGYQNRFRNMIKYLRESDVEVLVVTPGRLVTEDQSPSNRREPLTYHGARVVETLSFQLPWYEKLHMSFALSPKVLSELKSFKPDILHCSSPGFMVMAAVIYTKMMKVPLLLSYHTHIPRYVASYGLSWALKLTWSLIRVTHSLADMTLVTSSVILGEFLQEKVVPKNRMAVWRKAVDTEVFHPKWKSDQVRAEFTGNDSDAKILMYVGRLGSEKNLDLLKPIFDEVRRRNPNTHLVFVGDGPVRKNLEELFDGTPNTLFTGLLRGEALSKAYASADVFIMPSESETLGFVVLEAMASGVPVVAVKAGGIPDIVCADAKEKADGVKGDYGLLFEPGGDVQGASRCVEELLRSPSLCAEVGERGRQRVSQWDWQASTDHLLTEQYAACISNWRTFRKKLAFIVAIKKMVNDFLKPQKEQKQQQGGAAPSAA